MVNELSGLVFSIELVDPGGNGQLITGENTHNFEIELN